MCNCSPVDRQWQWGCFVDFFKLTFCTLQVLISSACRQWPGLMDEGKSRGSFYCLTVCYHHNTLMPFKLYPIIWTLQVDLLFSIAKRTVQYCSMLLQDSYCMFCVLYIKSTCEARGGNVKKFRDFAACSLKMRTGNPIPAIE